MHLLHENTHEYIFLQTVQQSTDDYYILQYVRTTVSA